MSKPVKYEAIAWKISNSPKTFGISHLPRRKRPVLYVMEIVDNVNTLIPLATFRDDESARVFDKHIRAVIQLGANKGEKP